MSQERLQQLLDELSQIFHLPLKIDRHHACSIQIKEGVTLQLQLDPLQENLFLFAKVGEVPPGKYRENVFKEALKTHSLPEPRIAHFGFIAKSAELALFHSYPLTILKGELLAGLIGAFLQYAIEWKKGLAQGTIPPPGLKL